MQKTLEEVAHRNVRTLQSGLVPGLLFSQCVCVCVSRDTNSADDLILFHVVFLQSYSFYPILV